MLSPLIHQVCSVDSFESPLCDHSLCLPPGAPARAQLNFASRMIRESFDDERPFDIMFNTMIGFDAAGIASDDIFDSFDYLLNTNVRASLVTARLAMHHLKPGGILVFLGSVAAFSPTKSLGYSAGKAALHQMIRNLALSVGDEFPEGARIIGLVPVVGCALPTQHAQRIFAPMLLSARVDAPRGTWMAR